LKKQTLFSASALLATALLANGAQAQEVYAGAGLFGAQIGYAYSVNPQFNLRGDYMTMGSRSKTQTESGTSYQAKLDLSRTALLVDWFPFESSSFRMTGGASFNKIGFNLTAGGAGSTVDINGRTVALGANDTLNVQVKLPNTTPYVGIGWGHKPSNKGWGFHTDLGVLVGSFKVTETRGGALVNGGALGVTQADMDKELQDVRDSVAKLKVLPQVTLGLSYRF
jgi:hypothetical protein